MKPRILLADDHPPLLEAASILLKPHFDLVGIATDGAMLVSEALRLRPDVIVTDITMPCCEWNRCCYSIAQVMVFREGSLLDCSFRRGVP